MEKNMSSKNERRRAKINAIYNITFDTKLATTYRDRSWKEIERLFGIKDKTLQPKKSMPTNIDDYLQQTETYRNYLAQTDLIGTYKISKDFAKAEQRKESFKQWKSERESIKRSAAAKAKKDYVPEKRSTKDDIWSYWSTPKEKITDVNKKVDFYMPEQFDTLASNINLSQGLDPNASFGYAVIYYSYLRDEPIVDVMNNVKVSNRFLETYDNPYKVQA